MLGILVQEANADNRQFDPPLSYARPEGRGGAVRGRIAFHVLSAAIAPIAVCSLLLSAVELIDRWFPAVLDNAPAWVDVIISWGLAVVPIAAGVFFVLLLPLTWRMRGLLVAVYVGIMWVILMVYSLFFYGIAFGRWL